MANKQISPNKKKIKKWSQKDEDILIQNMRKHVLCLKKGFEQTSIEIQRSPKAVAAHWYNHTSLKCGHVLFMTISCSHVAVNRKNSKGKPLKVSLYQKLLNLLGFSY